LLSSQARRKIHTVCGNPAETPTERYVPSTLHRDARGSDPRANIIEEHAMDFADLSNQGPCAPYRDLYNRGTLELTCKLLRKQRPALALQVQNVLFLAYPRHDYHTGLTAAELPLDVEVGRQIVQALSTLSDKLVAARQTQRAELVLIRSLLLDWLMFVRERQSD